VGKTECTTIYVKLYLKKARSRRMQYYFRGVGHFIRGLSDVHKVPRRYCHSTHIPIRDKHAKASYKAAHAHVSLLRLPLT
jgi:hypothetical protein